MARFERSRYVLEDDVLWFGGVSAERLNYIRGTEGDDQLEGTAGRDEFRVGQGGDDTLDGGAGKDRFLFEDAYTDSDIVFGGDGRDVLVLEGTSDRRLVLGPDNFVGVEQIRMGGGDFNIRLLDGTPDLKLLTTGAASANVDGSRVSASDLFLSGGGSAEVLVGGGGNDRIFGNGGSDTLTGGAGRNSFKYFSTIHSSELFSQTPDTITDIKRGDRIFLPESEFDGYHKGETPERVGDVVAEYDAPQDKTFLRVFTNSDDVADMTIILLGQHMDFEIRRELVIVFGFE